MLRIKRNLANIYIIIDITKENNNDKNALAIQFFVFMFRKISIIYTWKKYEICFNQLDAASSLIKMVNSDTTY